MVKAGYKQTDIGIIPEEWEVVSLLEKTDLINGLTYSPSNIQDYGLLVLRSSNVQNGKFSFADTVYVNCAVLKERLIKANDILICVRNGSAALIGKCAKADKDYNATFGAFMSVLRGINNDYIFQLLQQGTIQKQIAKNSDSTINQITNSDFKQIKIPFPQEESERIHIATALSDMDSLITNLEKLIAKKRTIKQGAMQELLTGKRRLPGFNSEWVKMTIGGMNGYLLRGSIDPQRYNSSLFFEYSMPAFDEGKGPQKIFGVDMHSNRTVISGKVLLFNKLNVRQKRIWLVNANEDNSICSSEFLAYCSDRIDLCFLAHLLSTEKITKDFIDMSTGSSNSQKRISPKNFMEYVICIPADKHEQSAIAKILSDMDSEIEELEKKLGKYKAIKVGMMNELLTGRIRLIDKEEA